MYVCKTNIKYIHLFKQQFCYALLETLLLPLSIFHPHPHNAQLVLLWTSCLCWCSCSYSCCCWYCRSCSCCCRSCSCCCCCCCCCGFPCPPWTQNFRPKPSVATRQSWTRCCCPGGSFAMMDISHAGGASENISKQHPVEEKKSQKYHDVTKKDGYKIKHLESKQLVLAQRMWCVDLFFLLRHLEAGRSEVVVMPEGAKHAGYRSEKICFCYLIWKETCNSAWGVPMTGVMKTHVLNGAYFGFFKLDTKHLFFREGSGTL